MTDDTVDTLTETLAALPVAPPELTARVLAGVGLGDWAVTVPGSPVGDLLVTYNDRGISGVGFGGEEAREALAASLGRALARPRHGMPTRLARALDRTLRTGRLGSLPLDLRGVAPFRAAALRKAAEIPPGEVRSYGWIARELDRPGASRAVGTAMATNRVPVLLPCHRVVPSDGSLGAYGGGVERKAALLAAEGVDVVALGERARRHVRYLASDTTGIYCEPTCRHARRITAAHLVELPDTRTAHALGFRACRTCRP